MNKNKLLGYASLMVSTAFTVWLVLDLSGTATHPLFNEWLAGVSIIGLVIIVPIASIRLIRVS